MQLVRGVGHSVIWAVAAMLHGPETGFSDVITVMSSSLLDTVDILSFSDVMSSFSCNIEGHGCSDI